MSKALVLHEEAEPKASFRGGEEEATVAHLAHLIDLLSRDQVTVLAYQNLLFCWSLSDPSFYECVSVICSGLLVSPSLRPHL